jgi:hypothetical protein
MIYSNYNQKFIFLEIINKFFLTKLKSYNLRLQLKFKLNFKLKILAVHYLILKFFSFNKPIILNKSKSNVICVFKQKFTKYTAKFLTKLNLETLLLSNKLILNKNFLTFSLKNFILFSKLEIFYNLLNTDCKIYLNFSINAAFSKKNLIYILKKYL